MNFVEFIAGPDDDGRRCDKVLRKLLGDIPLSAIYAAMRKRLVRVGGKRVLPSDRIRAGDVVFVASVLLNGKNAEKKIANIAQNESESLIRGFPYDIIFHNANFFVVNKPYGAKSQGTDSITAEVARLYRETVGARSLSFSPGPLHRLDERTSGILVFSWSIDGARFFSDALKNRRIKKIYLALVEGHMEQAAIWNDFIKKNDVHLPFQKSFVFAEGAANDLAITKAEPLAYGDYKDAPVTLVKFDIRTGRHHQIRAASAAHGFPLFGDTAYGAKPADIAQKLFLHASEVFVPENALGFPHSLRAPLPDIFAKRCAELFD